MEGNLGTGVLAVAHDLHRGDRLAFGVFLDMDLALTVNFCDEKVRKRIHAGYADSVETSGNLVV